jgi:RNA-directed DNA polymerase
MRRKNQVELNLGTGVTGEARSAAAQEIETGAAKACLERLAAGGPSMEAIVECNNLRKALEQVRRNKGSAGVDRMTIDQLGDYLKQHWPASSDGMARNEFREVAVDGITFDEL